MKLMANMIVIINNIEWDSGTLFTYYKTELDIDEKSNDVLYKTPYSMSSKRKRTKSYASIQQNNEYDSDDNNDNCSVYIIPKLI